MGSVSISETEIKITYPHGEKLTFLSTKSPKCVVGREYLVFEGIFFFLKEEWNERKSQSFLETKINQRASQISKKTKKGT